MESQHREPASTQKKVVHRLKFDFLVSSDILRFERSSVMDSLPMWLVGVLVFVAVIGAVVLPISLLFWQAARDKRAADKKVSLNHTKGPNV